MKVPVLLIKKGLLLLVSWACLLLFFFNIYYLLNSHQALLDQYLEINNCFYKQAFFDTAFFTPQTKATGNSVSLLSMMVSAGLFITCIRKFSRIDDEGYYIMTLNSWLVHLPPMLLVLLFSVSTWAYGAMLIPPAYDEVFSATQCTRLPFFQTLSYYMLPNNHIGFNLLNKVLFFWFDDKVWSGRILSFIAYGLWNMIAYVTLFKLTRSTFISLLSTIVLACMLPVWGFAFQSRGYELYGLCLYISFVSLYAWSVKPHNSYLLINTIVSVTGYACLPTYLYMHAAQLLFGLFIISKDRGGAKNYFRHQVYIFAAVFLFYVPAFCYSGIGAFTANKYVSAIQVPHLSFAAATLRGMPSYVQYAFSGFLIPGIIILCLPVLMLFHKNNSHRNMWLLYTCLVVATLVIMIIMRRNPYHRNLISHFYLAMFACIHAIYILINGLKEGLQRHVLNRLIMPAALGLLMFFFITRNSNAFNFFLYFDDIKSGSQVAEEVLTRIPLGSAITCSDGSFYLAYLADKKGYELKPCNPAMAYFFIMQSDERNSVIIPAHYEFYFKHGDYRVFVNRRDE